MNAILLRVLMSSWRMLVALLLGLTFYGFTVLKYPFVMNKMTSIARNIVERVGEIGLPAEYTVWVNILNVDDKLVFMGFIILARFLVALTWGIFITAPLNMIRGNGQPAGGSGTGQDELSAQGTPSPAKTGSPGAETRSDDGPKAQTSHQAVSTSEASRQGAMSAIQGVAATPKNTGVPQGGKPATSPQSAINLAIGPREELSGGTNGVRGEIFNDTSKSDKS